MVGSIYFRRMQLSRGAVLWPGGGPALEAGAHREKAVPAVRL